MNVEYSWLKMTNYNYIIIMNTSDEINENKMLEEIRSLLDLTMEKFVYQMNWPNTKYYDYIKNGRRFAGKKGRRKVHPTIHKVFKGINSAILNYPNWKKKCKRNNINSTKIHDAYSIYRLWDK